MADLPDLPSDYKPNPASFYQSPPGMQNARYNADIPQRPGMPDPQHQQAAVLGAKSAAPNAPTPPQPSADTAPAAPAPDVNASNLPQGALASPEQLDALPDLPDMPAEWATKHKNTTQGYDQRDYDLFKKFGMTDAMATKLAKKFWPLAQGVESVQSSGKAFNDAQLRSMMPDSVAAALEAAGAKIKGAVGSGPTPSYSDLYTASKERIAQQEQDHPVATAAGDFLGKTMGISAGGVNAAVNAEQTIARSGAIGPAVRTGEGLITGPGIDQAISKLGIPREIAEEFPNIMGKLPPTTRQAIMEFLNGPAKKAAKAALFYAIAGTAGGGVASYLAKRGAAHALFYE